MKSGGELNSYMHERGWISGSIYINVPINLGSTSGDLAFCLDDDLGLADDWKSKKIVSVATGSLVLFPSSLLHYTIPFKSEEKRIVLAFDMVPKNVIF